MCGIVGKLNTSPEEPVSIDLIDRMLNTIRHRGPDDAGVYAGDNVGLGGARLSIIDLAGGHQPICNEDETIWIVFNGEIYNYLELRADLVNAGHQFRTHCDTEVLVHLYEERESDWLEQLNGQFAIAIWDRRKGVLTLARDRLGVRPIYYTQTTAAFLFASEVKALLVDSAIRADMDTLALAQVFTFWTTLSPRSIFKNIYTVPPGCLLSVKQGQVSLKQYWRLNMSCSEDVPPSMDDAADQLRYLLSDAARMRLRADVPVGAYLSGGIDSSCIAALTKQHIDERLRTFSIGFSEQAFDETEHQARTNEFLNVESSQIICRPQDIGAAFPQVVYHAEMPVLRTSPVPMFLLSEHVHESNFKVVLTGEGADEILGGYDIFKETKIRQFWARHPDSSLRPLLLRRLYPYISSVSRGGDAYLKAFFGQGLTDLADPFYSHRLRWRNTARCWRFFSPHLRAELKDYDPLQDLADALPPEYHRWDAFAQAQYLEIAIFLSEYLLSSQGDRMSMAHSVEGRYPFLDPRVVDFSTGLPARFKMFGLREKAVLKHAMKDLLPPQTVRRHKQPYRAPILSAFFGEHSPDYVAELLSPESIRRTGYFDEDAVGSLAAKCRRGSPVSETEEMAVVGILSVLLLHRWFVDGQKVE